MDQDTKHALERYRGDFCREVDSGAEIGAQGAARVVLIIDEVENLITTQEGCILLENLRIAWESLAGQLGIIVLGGSALRKLLSSDVSPFLRSAQWIPLRGLARDETALLLREPCQLDIPDPMVDTLWEQSGGHPLLLQAVMEHAVNQGQPVLAHLPAALGHVLRELAPTTLFPIWWENLQSRGQDIYRKLLAYRRPLRRSDRLHVLGNEPHPWVEVLETTAVARDEGEELLVRGDGFRSWMEHNHPTPDIHHANSAPATKLSVADIDTRHPLERTVVTATARWARDTVEYPVIALASKSASGNDRLLPEQHFQIALLMHGAAPTPLAGRSRSLVSRRSCRSQDSLAQDAQCTSLRRGEDLGPQRLRRLSVPTHRPVRAARRYFRVYCHGRPSQAPPTRRVSRQSRPANGTATHR